MPRNLQRRSLIRSCNCLSMMSERTALPRGPSARSLPRSMRDNGCYQQSSKGSTLLVTRTVFATTLIRNGKVKKVGVQGGAVSEHHECDYRSPRIDRHCLAQVSLGFPRFSNSWPCLCGLSHYQRAKEERRSGIALRCRTSMSDNAVFAKI